MRPAEPQEVPTKDGDLARLRDATPAGLALLLLLVGAVVVALGAHLSLSRTLNINWDEWSYLAKVHTWSRGEPLSRLQTFHVHLFAPLLLDTGAGPDRELLEVLRLRAVSLGLLVASALAIVQLGRRLLGSVVAGLAAAFAALTFSFVLGHGTAARYDPFIVTSFLVAAAILVEAQRMTTTARAAGLAGLAGVLLALGAAVSIKIALFGPTLAVCLGVGVLGARAGEERRRAIIVVVCAGLVAVLGWRALLAWHGSVVGAAQLATSTSGASSAGLTGQLSAIGDMMFSADSDGPQRKYLRLSHRYDVGFWSLSALGVVLGLVVAVGRGPRSLQTPTARFGAVRALVFGLPLISLLVYRNTYPYFFVTIVPPAALLVGVVVAVADHALARWTWARLVVIVGLVVPAAVTGGRFYAFNHDDQQAPQRALLAGVHAVFPEPVPYIDRCGMIASHPRVGPFMSSATMAAYRAKPGALVWPHLLDTARPRFVVNNIASLDLRSPSFSETSRYRWQPDDYRLLQESFIPHWGPLWVAGRIVEVGPEPVEFTIHISDRYVVDAGGTIELDGVAVAPGAVVELAAGSHRALAASTTTLTLRTASAGPPPTIAPPGPLFTTFRPRGVPRLWKGRAAKEPVEEEAP